MKKRQILGVLVVMVVLTLGTSAAAATPKLGVLDNVLAVLSSGHIDISDIQTRFCTTLEPVPSSEGFPGSLRGKSNGCGLPIDFIRVDPVRYGSAELWMRLVFERTSCVPGDVLEDFFPGGERGNATDSGAPFYSVTVGKGSMSAIYDGATSRYRCVSEIYLQFQ